ncbi:MAG: hypothetical protein QG608_1957 [Actinomycetota bacterium]|nr:hypothetical protein [Actinomycetota bacterium]
MTAFTNGSPSHRDSVTGSNGSSVDVVLRAPQCSSEWTAYETLARSGFQEPDLSILPLRDHAITRLAIDRTGVVAGMMALRCEVFMGGLPVRAGALACLVVAPNRRGRGLAGRLMEEIVRALRGEGRVLSVLWTPAVGLYRRWGWEVGGTGRGWAILASELAGSPRPEAIENGLGPGGAALHDRLASRWNGALRRPSWWWDWKYPAGDPEKFLYRSYASNGRTTGIVGYHHRRRDPWGYDIIVTDLWAENHPHSRQLFGFLGDHSSQAHRIVFEHASMPSPPPFLWELSQHRAVEQPWYPWMINLIDVRGALLSRGWPREVRGSVDFEIENLDGTCDRLVLTVVEGTAQVEPGGRGEVRISRNILASWYCGALSSGHLAALLPDLSEDTIHFLCALSSGPAPWLPDVF